jgi:tRNA threonylcarbamoyladenosine biosynthesis protein TsaE
MPVQLETTRRLELSGLEELRRFAASLAASLAPGQVWLLRGDLGAGKTTLVREVCAALGVARHKVVSPSFTLLQEYEGGRLPVVHVDLYRLDAGRGLDSLGLEEQFARTDSVMFIEWPDSAGDRIPPWALSLGLEFGSAEGARVLTVPQLVPAPATGLIGPER